MVGKRVSANSDCSRRDVTPTTMSSSEEAFDLDNVSDNDSESEGYVPPIKNKVSYCHPSEF